MLLAASQIEQIEGAVNPGFVFKKATLGNLVGSIVPYIFAATGAALIIYIIWGGISLMLSLGDPKSVAAARAKITTGIIGALIVVFAYTLMQIAGKIFNLTDINTLFSK